jgi:chromosome segregation ATPase
MDYTNLLNEKENQIVELEKKINNLEERLRRAAARETELENHIVALTSDVRRKDGIVGMKNDQIMAEVASSNVYKDAWTKLKLKIDQNRAQLGPLANTLFDGIQIPDGLDIRADALIKDSGAVRSSAYQAQSQPQKYKTNAVALFREL